MSFLAFLSNISTLLNRLIQIFSKTPEQKIEEAAASTDEQIKKEEKEGRP